MSRPQCSRRDQTTSLDTGVSCGASRAGPRVGLCDPGGYSIFRSSPPRAARGQRRARGRCRTRCPTAAGGSAPRPWQRLLRASARALRIKDGLRSARGSLAVLVAPHHVPGWKRNKRNARFNFMKGEGKKKTTKKHTFNSKRS